MMALLRVAILTCYFVGATLVTISVSEPRAYADAELRPCGDCDCSATVACNHGPTTPCGGCSCNVPVSSCY